MRPCIWQWGVQGIATVIWDLCSAVSSLSTQQNELESKDCIIRDIFLHLNELTDIAKQQSQEAQAQLQQCLGRKAIRISNHRYGSDVASEN